MPVRHVPLKPFRQPWLPPALLHSAPSAELFCTGGKQWAQLEHPLGGPLTCVQNRTGETATAVERVAGLWCWVLPA